MPDSRFKDWIHDSEHIVFFGGAGVSTESEIPDFRSVDGLYHQSYRFPPETIISRSFFDRNPEEFYRFYREKMLYLNAKPNITHIRLAELEQAGKLDAIVTQNIDGLHQAAGSRIVYELHGSVHRNYCMRCRAYYDAEYVLHSKEMVPKCSCGGIIKPDVVLYEESLNSDILENAVRAISKADMLIVAGTSLSVYPAAGLVAYYKQNRLVLINKSKTPLDGSADMVIQGTLGEIFGGISI